MAHNLIDFDVSDATATATRCGPVGTTFEFDNVSVTYDVVGGISGNVMMGDRPLISRCVGG